MVEAIQRYSHHHGQRLSVVRWGGNALHLQLEALHATRDNDYYFEDLPLGRLGPTRPGSSPDVKGRRQQSADDDGDVCLGSERRGSGIPRTPLGSFFCPQVRERSATSSIQYGRWKRSRRWRKLRCGHDLFVADPKDAYRNHAG